MKIVKKTEIELVAVVRDAIREMLEAGVLHGIAKLQPEIHWPHTLALPALLQKLDNIAEGFAQLLLIVALSRRVWLKEALEIRLSEHPIQFGAVPKALDD